MVTLILQENIKCAYGLWGNLVNDKDCFPDANHIKTCPKKTVCKECTYVERDRNEID